MTPEEYRAAMDWDKTLTVGMPVIVRWGYGLGFRVEAHGHITRIFPKSVRVQIHHDVMLEPGKRGWPKGFTVEGVPRFSPFNSRWDERFCVMPDTAA